jgi:hypothetical protein
MKTNLLFNNKNVFAFALCFAAFTAQADDSVETTQIIENNVETTETFPIMTNIDGQDFYVDALVVSLEDAKKILNAQDIETMMAMFDEAIRNENIIFNGISFTLNEVTYFVKASDFMHEVTKNNVTDELVESEEKADNEEFELKE